MVVLGSYALPDLVDERRLVLLSPSESFGREVPQKFSSASRFSVLARTEGAVKEGSSLALG